ncbi:MAG: hypothetical protein V3U34_00575 [candidate division NC10 bacterium]
MTIDAPMKRIHDLEGGVLKLREAIKIQQEMLRALEKVVKLLGDTHVAALELAAKQDQRLEKLEQRNEP